MQAGRMKYRLELLEPKMTRDKMGAEVTTFTKVRTVHAERVKMSGKMSETNGEMFSDYRVEYNVRDCHPVCENWRVQQLGGYMYTVVNIIPNVDRGMMTLVCERYNE